MDGTFKSLISRWFGDKKKKKDEDDEGKDCQYFIKRDTLIKLSAKRRIGDRRELQGAWDLQQTLQQVVSWVWRETSCVQSTEHNLGNLLKEVQTTGKDDEVDGVARLLGGRVKKDSEWSPKAGFRVVLLADVLSVETKLESSNDKYLVVMEKK